MFKSGDMVVAVKAIKTKRNDVIVEGTVGIVHFYSDMRDEAAVLFVGHLMAYMIKAEDIKHAG